MLGTIGENKLFSVLYQVLKFISLSIKETCKNLRKGNLMAPKTQILFDLHHHGIQPETRDIYIHSYFDDDNNNG